ncbi:hypothetical protein L3X38_014804 [Prunus dulcis]|uniref:Uncharacterized protein n=1 Tax=Prunus dulcis TaxID=3755 RepID=A0AAD4WNX8_PRUDU|nr:hypothetical protein L3X38_014804 [Prunus dulcis]
MASIKRYIWVLKLQLHNHHTNHGAELGTDPWIYPILTTRGVSALLKKEKSRVMVSYIIFTRIRIRLLRERRIRSGSQKVTEQSFLLAVRTSTAVS